MITDNFKAILAASLQSSGAQYGYLPVRDVNGRQYYLCPNFDRFPYDRTQTFTTAAGTAGISLGRGTKEASPRDYNLQSIITSGLNVAITATQVGSETPGDPYLRYNMTITNTSSSTITITEVCYKQRVRVANGPGRNENNDLVIMLDRTVLETPITLAAGDAGVIQYKLKTLMGYPTVGGIVMAPFAWGSDEQISAMIDAAHLGEIDLQEDAGWGVGDLRKIRINAFTDSLGKSYPAQDIEIVISSFAEYNGCGNVLQFDFNQALTVQRRIRSSNLTAGGYENTEMYSDVMPKLVDAMPNWIKTRLKTFMVKSWDTSAGSILEVPNNKLALRARVEIFGNAGVNVDAEGSQVSLYSRLTAMRNKRIGYSGNSSFYHWTRTPYNSSNNYVIYYNNPSNNDYSTMTNERGFAPFGCM